MLFAIFWLAGELIHLMILAIIIVVVLSMLISFGVVDRRNQLDYSVAHLLEQVTNPLLAPIPRPLPLFGNVDISPLIAILLLQALQFVLSDVYGRLVTAGLGF